MKPMRTAALIVGLSLLASPALAQSLTLTGLNGQAVTLTAADIAGLPQVQVGFDIHGHKNTYQGPLLMDVLAKVGAPHGETFRGPDLADVIVSGSADGYHVAFGLGDADPALRSNRMILADKVDGYPLDAKDGPYRIIVEGDIEPKRSARMVTSLSVVRVGAAKP